MAGLSAKFIASAKPGRHGDGGGLYLYVKDSGAKSWVLRIQWDGKRHDIGLGSVNEAPRRDGDLDLLAAVPILQRRVLRLVEAREKAALLRNLAKSGRNPLVERDQEREIATTFRQAMEKTHSALSPGWGEKTAASFLTTLKTHACPHLGDILVEKVSARDIQSALREIWTAKPQQARKVRHRINQVLNFAHGQGWRSSEAPTRSVTSGLPKQPKGGNFDAMPFAGVPKFVCEISSGAPSVSREALLFLILTCSRSGEVRQCRWGQLDLENEVWNCPAEIMKAREAHTVTLSSPAVRLLKRLKVKRGRTEANDLVFPGKAGAIMSDMTLQKVVRRLGYAHDPHGFRSSFRDWAAEERPDVPDAVAEAALAHAVSDKVVRAYKRTKFLQMRRKLLEDWGDYVVKEANDL